MAKKRKTLPKDFQEMINKGDISALKAVFDECDINAYGGYWKGNALSFHGISEEFIRWLTQQGADVNAMDTFGRTPICTQAEDDNGNLKLLLELGANIEAGGKHIRMTPLYTAALRYNEEMVKALINNGADINSKNGLQEETPLEGALASCSNANIEDMASIADALLEAGAVVTPEMSEYVRRIGETFEFYRGDFNKDFLPQTEIALDHLYKLFGVQPIAKRKTFDGVSPIKVKATIWQKQFNELWDMLVPGRGNASTVQGEVIRICGKVSREILDNGAANWSKEYKKLPQALPGYFSMGNPLEPVDFKEAEILSNSISANSDEDSLNRLTELAVKWVLLNPSPLALQDVDYTR